MKSLLEEGKKVIQSTNGNIKNVLLFDTKTHLNSDLFYQRKEINQITHPLLQFLLLGDRNNLLIYGSIGCGKTHLIHFILDEAKKDYSFDYSYVNCREHNTSYKILKCLLGEKKKIPYDTALTEVVSLFNKDGGKKVLVLDEADMLKDDLLIYNLTRKEEMSHTLFIIITNKYDYYQRCLSPDVRSSLSYNLIIFKDYDADDIFQILDKRCKLGLVSYDSFVLRQVAAFNVRDHNSDVRVGIKSAKKIFSSDSSSKLDNPQIEYIMKNESIHIKNSIIENLLDNKLLLIYLIQKIESEGRGCYSNELYNEYRRYGQEIVKSYFFERISELEKLGLIFVTEERKGRSKVKVINSKLYNENIESIKNLCVLRGLII